MIKTAIAEIHIIKQIEQQLVSTIYEPWTILLFEEEVITLDSFPDESYKGKFKI